MVSYACKNRCCYAVFAKIESFELKSKNNSRTIENWEWGGWEKDIYLIYKSITLHKIFSKIVNYFIVAVRFCLFTQINTVS